MIIRDDLFQMIEAMSGEEGLVYVSVPITSGRRHFEYLVRHPNGVGGVDRARWCKEVKRPNLDDSRAFAQVVRAQHPGRAVLNPALIEKPQWSQDDYNGMWLEVIARYADVVVATPDWAWSRGARLEVGAALFHGKSVTTLEGQPLGERALRAAAGQATAELAAMGLPTELAASALPDLVIDHPTLPVNPASQAFEWLIAERGYQIRKFGTALDDEHTREGLGPDVWWRRQLDNYIHRAFVLGLDLPVGRQALAKFVATAAGLLESTIRVHGPLPAPGVPSGEISDVAVRANASTDC